MSLILLVEPDRRHAAQLASMARNHLHAELVVAESGDHAVAALADRVPDIVLTAPLLPHHDEVVLSDYLRNLGTAGAHVQTLTIPILSTPDAQPRATRALFRREKDPVHPEGCDPALFAEQVGQYLRRARQVRIDGVVTPQPEERLEASPELAAAPTTSQVLSAMDVVLERPEDDVDLTEFLTEPEIEPQAPPPVRTAGFVTPERVTTPERVITPERATTSEWIITPDRMITPQRVTAPERLVASTPAVTPASVVIPEPVRPPEPVVAPPAYVAPPPPVVTSPELPRHSVMVPEVLPERPEVLHAELATPPSPPRVERTRPAKPAISQEARRYREEVPSTNLPAVIKPVSHPLPEPEPTVHLPQVITVPTPGPNGQPVNVAVAVSVQVAANTTSVAAPSTPRQRPTGARPVQDEWGFFDPDQCGFKALLARLDAIATTDERDS